MDERQEVKTRENKSDSVRMIGLVRDIGNKLVIRLKLTVDLPDFHPTGKCPMLDIQVWIEERTCFCRIPHSFS